MSSTKKWLPLESNPEVLNDFVTKLGLDVSNYSFTDIFGLDEELLAMVPQPVLAVIMCYPITKESEAASKEEDAEQAAKGMTPDPELFYMKQTIGNACGTIAVLHAIGNHLQTLQPAAGSFLSQFYGATAALDPAARGRYLEAPPEGAPSIEQAHQAAASAGDTAPPSADDDVDLHFVAFIERAGVLWELDGRRAGPVCHGPLSGAANEALLRDTATVVRKFVDRSSSISFNLLALTATPTD